MEKVVRENFRQQDFKEQEIASRCIWSKDSFQFEHNYTATKDYCIIEGASKVEIEGKKYVIEPDQFDIFNVNFQYTRKIQSIVRKYTKLL